jgi:hypothetical protein
LRADIHSQRILIASLPSNDETSNDELVPPNRYWNVILQPISANSPVCGSEKLLLRPAEGLRCSLSSMMARPNNFFEHYFYRDTIVCETYHGFFRRIIGLHQIILSSQTCLVLARTSDRASTCGHLKALHRRMRPHMELSSTERV